ncbi:MAG: hypothetical protein IKU19_01190 [Clostridia bacterium]|nr:hypothetical protein [Clostridia bacterium]
MKKTLLFVIALLMILTLCGCINTSDPIPENTTEIVADTGETALETDERVSETENVTETEAVVNRTEAMTEEILDNETEADSDRVTEVATEPVTKPFTQSYLEMYEPKDMDISGVEKYVVSDSEYAVTVIFEAKGEITDFRICGVEMTYGYDEITDTVLDIEALSEGDRIAVMLDFPGDMSSWYYSYTNNVGKTFENQIYMSGMDGSIVSTEWQQ